MDVLNFMNETGTSLLETAVIYNIPDIDYFTVEKTLEKQGIDALYSKNGASNDEKETKKEQPVEGCRSIISGNRAFTYGKCIFKKLNALVQEEKISELIINASLNMYSNA